MSRHTEQGAEAEITAILQVIREIAGDLGVSNATVSLAWAMKNQAITNTLVGSRDCKELLSNIQAADFELPNDAYDVLNTASQPILVLLGNNPDFYQNRKESRIW